MTQTEASRSAQNVALARAHLTWMGIVDDPYAQQMLAPDRRRIAAALRLPGLRLLGRHPTFPGLARRTLFFDRFVNDALDDGLRQVAIVAAGYDSRAWRLARPGVTFFEIDQPATQQDKRAKAPEGGPVYIPVDVTDSTFDDKLVQAGFQTEEPAAFTVEGLTIYLTAEDVAKLFTKLAGLATSGSRLAVSFSSGFERQRITRWISRAYYKRSGEHWRFRLPAEEAPSFFAKAGWTVSSLLTAPDLDKQYLSQTKLAGRTNTTSYVVIATK